MVQEEFLHEVDNYTNHRVLLWPALQATEHYTTRDILELGVGWGSTPFLHQYAVSSGRKLVSIDSSVDWARELGQFNHPPTHEIFTDFTLMLKRRWAVALIDHAPGERRVLDLISLKPLTTVIVVHDTEPHLAHQYDSVWSRFRYKVDVAGHLNGAWATAVSDTLDVTRWKGQELGGFVIK
jgi:hypothetical protein